MNDRVHQRDGGTKPAYMVAHYASEAYQPGKALSLQAATSALVLFEGRR
jgi:hypothetical protein